MDQLCWSESETQQGNLMKLRGFPKAKQVKLFRVIVSTDKTEYVVTNDDRDGSPCCDDGSDRR
jgi:hypothetical protein